MEILPQAYIWYVEDKIFMRNAEFGQKHNFSWQPITCKTQSIIKISEAHPKSHCGQPSSKPKIYKLPNSLASPISHFILPIFLYPQPWWFAEQPRWRYQYYLGWFKQILLEGFSCRPSETAFSKKQLLPACMLFESRTLCLMKISDTLKQSQDV